MKLLSTFSLSSSSTGKGEPSQFILEPLSQWMTFLPPLQLRFCVERFAPRRKQSTDASNSRPNHSTSSPSESPTHTGHRKSSLPSFSMCAKGDSQLFGKCVNCIPSSQPSTIALSHFILHNKSCGSSLASFPGLLRGWLRPRNTFIL